MIRQWPPWLRLVMLTLCFRLTAAAEGGVCAHWTDHSLVVKARSGHALTYDPPRDRLVLFGGSSDGVLLNDTWEFDGTVWSEVTAAGPTARTGHAMVFDPVRNVTVLFGGRSGATRLGDTWEWNGTRWIQKLVPAPSPRDAHAMVYQSSTGTILLFGGDTDAGLSSDTWIWNGQSWRLVTRAGPAPRAEHALAYDSVRHRTILFGGSAGGGLEGDTWEWNGIQWAQVAIAGPDSPTPRSGHAMTCQTGPPGFGASDTLLFGGYDGSDRGDTWAWDGAEWNLLSTRGPTPRRGHAMTFDTLRRTTFLFGGSGGADQGDTWGWDGSWYPVLTSPTARFDHAMVYDASRGTTLLFGGFDGRLRADTWEWNGRWWTPRSPAHRPPPLVRHAMAYDSTRRATVLFGGYSLEGYRGETWEWDGSDWRRVAVYDPTDSGSGPSPREEHVMVYDRHNDVTLLIGGWTRSGPEGFRETWAWNGHTQQWTKLSSEGPEAWACYQSAIAYDDGDDDQVAVLLGGGGYAGGFGQNTWEWNSQARTWHETLTTCTPDPGRPMSPLAPLDPPVPCPRALHAMAYSDGLGKVLLFGGLDTTQRDDLWAWDVITQTWSRLTSSGPPARYDHAMVYDSRRRLLVMFGGLDDTGKMHGDLWEASLIPSDFNCDGRVDELDLGRWQSCASGSGVPVTSPDCRDADLDHDGDVDQNDFGQLQRCYSGPTPANPACTG